MINFYVKSLKLTNHLILTIPSNPTLTVSLQLAEKPLHPTCVANKLSSFYTSRKIAESNKSRTEELGKNELR